MTGIRDRPVAMVEMKNQTQVKLHFHDSAPIGDRGP